MTITTSIKKDTLINLTKYFLYLIIPLNLIALFIENIPFLIFILLTISFIIELLSINKLLFPNDEDYIYE